MPHTSRALLAAVLVTAAASAGCLSADDGPADATADDGTGATDAFVPEAPDFDFSTVVDPDHEAHTVAMLHDAGHGLDLVGFTAIQPSLPPGVRGSITQIDVWGTYALVPGMEGGLAFAIVDIADPAAPKVVSYAEAPADGWTARFSDDGQYVFYGCQVLGGQFGAATAVTSTRPTGSCQDPDAMDPLAATNGIVAFDVSDKTAPKIVAFVETQAAHNIQVAAIGGYDYVFTNAVEIVRFDRVAGTLEVVAEVPGVHDATVAKHPITGDVLLYTGTDELSIYDIDDPAAPVPVLEGADGIEGWTDAMRGWHEQTVVPGLIEGRYVLALAGEVFTSATGGVPDVVTIVDITDPAKPAVLGTWSPPFAPMAPWLSYWYSVHEMAATPGGQIAIGWYHGGVWVIDVSTAERQAAPMTLAAYQPHHDITVVPSTFFQTAVPVVPFVWGAGWDARGYLVVPDMHTGVYVLEPEWGLRPAVDSGQ